MKVQELIERLQQHPPDMRVIVEGYEAGYNDVNTVRELPLTLDVYKDGADYYGDHAEHHGNTGGDETALLISNEVKK